NAQLKARADERAGATSNPAVGAALRRFIDHLPAGPFTAGELEAELEMLDLSDLADSTARSYAGSIRSFIRALRGAS
ncbi:MAG: hypothetical protein KY437_06455, partial [Actinobacteria bacterium]|nr:hypothetical protein [Actinomycetota bacterium]